MIISDRTLVFHTADDLSGMCAPEYMTAVVAVADERRLSIQCGADIAGQTADGDGATHITALICIQDLCRTHIADQAADFGKAFDDRVVIAVAHGGIHGLSDQGTDFIARFDHAAFDAQAADRSALHHVEQTDRILLLIDMQIIDDMPCAIERAAEAVHGCHAGKRDIFHLDIGAHPIISCGTVCRDIDHAGHLDQIFSILDQIRIFLGP